MARRMRRLQFLMRSSGDLGARPRCKSFSSPTTCCRALWLPASEICLWGRQSRGPSRGRYQQEAHSLGGEENASYARQAARGSNCCQCPSLPPLCLVKSEAGPPGIVDCPIGRESRACRLKVFKYLQYWVDVGVQLFLLFAQLELSLANERGIIRCSTSGAFLERHPCAYLSDYGSVRDGSV